ncbi:hypothetical protein B0H12DRAFT_538968 [Mycena haematopus]|nr:hypothetical protein B0H12DRAFT_538968 [Mycena haematopus]
MYSLSFVSSVLDPQSSHQGPCTDGYRCVLSNTVDKHSYQGHLAVQKLCEESDACVHPVRTSHIFNESLLQKVEPTDEYPQQARRHHGATAIRILQTFGVGEVVERLLTD